MSGPCGASNPDGYAATCQDENPRHRYPHAASGEGWSMAWCTPPQPCRGGSCSGPCHAGDPHGRPGRIGQHGAGESATLGA